MTSIQSGHSGVDRDSAWPPTMTTEQERAYSAGVPGASTAPGAPTGPLPSLANVQNLATWAIVLGITSIFVNPFGAASIAAIICGALSLSRRSTLERAGHAVPPMTLALVGLILGAVALINTGVFKAFLF